MKKELRFITGTWKASVTTRNDTCLLITLNIYIFINVIYRQVSFLVVTQVFKMPVVSCYFRKSM